MQGAVEPSFRARDHYEPPSSTLVAGKEVGVQAPLTRTLVVVGRRGRVGAGATRHLLPAQCGVFLHICQSHVAPMFKSIH